jgi:acetolactate synthase-1/2/3 large subunit
MNEKIRVVDYVANRLCDLGIEHVFTLTGGGAMFLNDGVAAHPKLKAICNHHEQACAQAAVAYSKFKNDFSVVMPTTGCGSTNAITGLLDAWQDSVPCIFISGQVNKMQTCYNSKAKLRQFGVQEANIVEIVKSITKYAVMINDPEEIAYHIDKAFYLASIGRKGPVWIDIPMDIQGSFIDPLTLKRFSPEPAKKQAFNFETLKEAFKSSERPVILAGNGIRLASATNELKEFAEKYNIPIVTTFLGIDLIDGDNPLNIGPVGVKGTRAANFAMQNSDLLISIGTRLSVPVTGYKYEMFAREATLVVVDIDPEEHKKDTVKIDLFIESDAKDFMSTFNYEHKFSDKWTRQCCEWKKKWPINLPEYKDDKDGISLYYFMDRLANALEKDSIVVSDAGSAYYTTAQGLKFTKEQRHITSGAQAEMGFTIPASIGASIASDNGKVIGITGDGSFQTNIQELQTILYYNLPIKTFVLNNNGYLSIRTTQRKYFKERFIGTDKSSGVSFPDTEKIANAYGMKYVKIEKIVDLDDSLKKVIESNEPVICEIICKEWDAILPTLSAKKTADGKMVSKPLEDMFPFLDRKEFYDNMYVKPIEEK